MHFDDRLATVLRQSVTGQALARIQYRQLLDLLGTLPANAHGPQLDAAWLRLGELSALVPAPERIAMLGDPGMRLRNPRLIAQLAEGDAGIAVAAIARASLREDEWLDLVPALPIAARGVLRHRRDLGERVDTALARLGIVDRALPPAAAHASDSPAAAHANDSQAAAIETPDNRVTLLRLRPNFAV